MSKSYVIQWKSKINGRTGRGTKQFELEEAQKLANELNQEYPDIEHEVVEATAPQPEPGSLKAEPMARAEQSGRQDNLEEFEQPEAGAENSQVTHDPDQPLSFQ